MKILAVIGICLLTALPARAQAPPAAPAAAVPSFARSSTGTIHPSVARIVAPAEGSVSYGSGTLVYVNDQMGLVITNWHVVHEATGPISVHFPDGFYSLGTVQQVDRDWDLAIIAIRKPNAEAVPLANEAPRPGEILTIAGYGKGDYRAASGRCTQYVAPGTSFPFEMVEVAVSARQGDSGGPIFNEKGELAGVLFGEGHGRTSGSYCGRVRWFLTSVIRDTPASATAIAESSRLAPLPARARDETPSVAGAISLTQPSRVPVESVAAAGHVANAGSATISAPPSVPTASLSARVEPLDQPQVMHLSWQDVAGETIGEQAKTVLALVGVLAIILQALRLAGGQPGKA